MRKVWKFWIVFAKRNSRAFDAAIYHCVLAQFMAAIVRTTMTAIFFQSCDSPFDQVSAIAHAFGEVSFERRVVGDLSPHAASNFDGRSADETGIFTR